MKKVLLCAMVLSGGLVYSASSSGSSQGNIAFEHLRQLIERNRHMNADQQSECVDELLGTFDSVNLNERVCSEWRHTSLNGDTLLTALMRNLSSLCHYEVLGDDISMTILAALIAKGADVNKCNSRGTAPLRLSVFKYVPNVTTSLLDHGAQYDLSLLNMVINPGAIGPRIREPKDIASVIDLFLKHGQCKAVNVKFVEMAKECKLAFQDNATVKSVMGVIEAHELSLQELSGDNDISAAASSTALVKRD